MTIEKISWKEIRLKVKQVNPKLFNIIEEFNPDESYQLFKASYEYGDKILKDGEINIPTKGGQPVPLSSFGDRYLTEQLSYRCVPLGLILDNSMEVFFETQSRVMTSKLYGSGTFFGLWELYDVIPHAYLNHIWNLSAGTRSIFSLPKIADNVSHRRLKKQFGISADAPSDLMHQHAVFAELAKNANSSWRCEVLLFGKKWSEQDSQNLNSVRLHNYWLRDAWQQSQNCRNQMDYNISWETYSKHLNAKNWKVHPLIINTLKHLIAISEGVFPGFSVANSDECAPISLLSNIYNEVYQMSKHPICFMRPHHLLNKDEMVYYSLNFPTILEWAPRNKKSGSIMDDLKTLKRVVDLFIETSETHLNYEFFHSDNDVFQEVQPIQNLIQTDLTFSSLERGEKLTPSTASFFRGCVRVSQ